MKLPMILAHHEQSETLGTDTGYINVYGRNTPNAGKPLTPKHEFESSQYPDLTDAVMSAIMRSLWEGLSQQFTGGNLPGRRP